MVIEAIEASSFQEDMQLSTHLNQILVGSIPFSLPTIEPTVEPTIEKPTMEVNHSQNITVPIASKTPKTKPSTKKSKSIDRSKIRRSNRIASGSGKKPVIDPTVYSISDSDSENILSVTPVSKHTQDEKSSSSASPSSSSEKPSSS
jgi:hypothetical protein